MAKFFENNVFSKFTTFVTVLGFAEDRNYSDSARQRQFDKINFNLFVDYDGQFRLYKDGKEVLTGSAKSAEDQARLIEASRDKMLYKTREAWIASLVTAAATYRRLADERLEAARKDLAQFAGLEAKLLRGLHDLRKTAKIAEEGHQ